MLSMSTVLDFHMQLFSRKHFKIIELTFTRKPCENIMPWNSVLEPNLRVFDIEETFTEMQLMYEVPRDHV